MITGGGGEVHGYEGKEKGDVECEGWKMGQLRAVWYGQQRKG